jgi:hypothetical protein
MAMAKFLGYPQTNKYKYKAQVKSEPISTRGGSGEAWQGERRSAFAFVGHEGAVDIFACMCFVIYYYTI